MRAVITVIGQDRVGIIAAISSVLASANINILDITQTIMQELFTMVMLVDIELAVLDFEQIRQQLETKGQELNLSIRIQHEDLFKSMHQV